MKASIMAAGLFTITAMAGQQPAAGDKRGGRMSGERAARSQVASEMLRHIDQARLEIGKRDRIAATRHIGQAQNALRKLNPEAAAQGQSARNIVPIYEELEQASIIGPIQAAKQTSQAQSPESAPAGRARQPAPSSADRSATSPEVRKMAAEYTVIWLDTSAATPHLEAAEAAIKQGNLAQADAGLQAIQASVALTTADADPPLLLARRSLAQAHRMVAEGAIKPRRPRCATLPTR